MKSLSMLVGSLLVMGIMSGEAGAATGGRGGAMPAGQTKQLEEQMQKSDQTKAQTTDGTEKTK